MQFVHVVERGERAQMSKRSGDFVTLDELIDDIGVDAARFFMLQRSHDTTLDLDLDLARAQSQENPVYYVQYAHARIASILRKAVARARSAARRGRDEAGRPGRPRRARGAGRAGRAGADPPPARVARGGGSRGRARAPHRLCRLRAATAADFHAFYRDCQVVGAPDGSAGAGPPGDLRGGEAGDRPDARSARGRRPGADVAAGRALKAAVRFRPPASDEEEDH